jgi:hypothetical protein
MSEILVRPHRGTLADSMSAVRPVQDRPGLLKLIQADFSDATMEDIEITPYASTTGSAGTLTWS